MTIEMEYRLCNTCTSNSKRKKVYEDHVIVIKFNYSKRNSFNIQAKLRNCLQCTLKCGKFLILENCHIML